MTSISFKQRRQAMWEWYGKQEVMALKVLLETVWEDGLIKALFIM